MKQTRAVQDGLVQLHSPTTRQVLRSAIGLRVLSYHMLLSAYARATRCAVLRWGRLGASSAVCDTEIGYASMRSVVLSQARCYAMWGTELGYASTRMCGTELAYGAMGSADTGHGPVVEMIKVDALEGHATAVADIRARYAPTLSSYDLPTRRLLPAYEFPMLCPLSAYARATPHLVLAARTPPLYGYAVPCTRAYAATLPAYTPPTRCPPRRDSPPDPLVTQGASRVGHPTGIFPYQPMPPFPIVLSVCYAMSGTALA
eukprot:1935015-Rhodomonas_salina.1